MEVTEGFFEKRWRN